MSGDVIKSFLVGLGFEVDDSSLAKFNKSIASATLKVAALYGSIQIASAGIVKSISSISDSFEELGYEYKILAPAINKAIVLRQELLKAYSAAGINITKTVQASVKLNLSLTKTKFALDAIYKSVGSKFFDTLTKQSDLFRQKIYANMPKIQNVLERLVKFIFKALEATTALGIRLWSILTRVYDFFVTLDKATDGWSTRILAVIAAWKLLNLEFLATPLGMIIAGLLAILTLFDDFKTFQEGGESLFNWTPFIPVIDAVTSALQSLWAVLQAIADVLGNLFLAFYQLFQGDKASFFDSLRESASSLLDVFARLWDSIKGIGGALGALGGFTAGLFSNPNAQTNVQNGTNGGVPPVSPVGASTQNSQTNQNVQQQTNINVMGSADANAVGKAVSGEQTKVNMDMSRNFKTRVR